MLTRAQDRLRGAQHAIAHGPNLGMLERGIRDVVCRLEPRELTELRRILTTPQAAIAFRVEIRATPPRAWTVRPLATAVPRTRGHGLFLIDGDEL